MTPFEIGLLILAGLALGAFLGLIVIVVRKMNRLFP